MAAMQRFWSILGSGDMDIGIPLLTGNTNRRTPSPSVRTVAERLRPPAQLSA